MNFAQTIKTNHIPNVSARAAGSSSTFHLSTHHLLHICDLHKCYGISNGSNQAENTKKETITHDAWDGSMPPKPSIIPPMFSILPNSCDPSAEFLFRLPSILPSTNNSPTTMLRKHWQPSSSSSWQGAENHTWTWSSAKARDKIYR